MEFYLLRWADRVARSDVRCVNRPRCSNALRCVRETFVGSAGGIVARSRRRPTTGPQTTSFASGLARPSFYFYDGGYRIATSRISFRYALRITDFANLFCIFFA